MKTSSKIFATLFTVLCLLAVGAVICGKTHQWVMVVASGVMAVALWAEVLHKDKSSILPLNMSSKTEIESFNSEMLKTIQYQRKESQERLSDFFASISPGCIDNADIGQISPVHSPSNIHQETEI